MPRRDFDADSLYSIEVEEGGAIRLTPVANWAEHPQQELQRLEERLRQMRVEILAEVRAELAAGLEGLGDVSARLSRLEARFDTELAAQREELEQRTVRKPLTYSVEEAAELLRLSVRHVYQMIRLGKLPSTRIGSRLLVPANLLDDFLRGEWKPESDDGNDQESTDA